MVTIRLQRFIAIFSIVLFLGKIWAYFLTGSVSILTDALESIVNIVAGFIGLYSLIIASKPRDSNHPYGHGKAEYISAAIEGTLIMLAALFICYEGVKQLLEPHPIKKLDIGIILVLATGIINYLIGRYAIALGRKHNSQTVQAAGAHLSSDAYSTAAIVLGLGLVYITKWQWLDAAVAMAFAVIIFITGYRVLRRSLSGIMDEADLVLLNKVVAVLQQNRKPDWIDLHNLRVIQYGDVMHVDAHMTLPYYHDVRSAENEVNVLEKLITAHFAEKVELFIHIDGCMPYQCRICSVKDCPKRENAFEQSEEWTVANVLTNSRHGKSTMLLNP